MQITFFSLYALAYTNGVIAKRECLLYGFMFGFKMLLLWLVSSSLFQ